MQALNTAIGNLTSNVSSALTNYQSEATAIYNIYWAVVTRIKNAYNGVNDAKTKLDMCLAYFGDVFKC